MNGDQARQLDLWTWAEVQVPCPASAELGLGPVSETDAPVLLTRVDPSCNMHRFYSLALATSLFGKPGVVRAWGRIGRAGRDRTNWYDAPEAAQAELVKVAMRKRRRGYR